MTKNELLFLFPLGFLLLGALVCLVLEAAGTPVGARKKGARVHLAMLSLFSAIAAFTQLYVLGQAVTPTSLFSGLVKADQFGFLCGCLMIGVLVLTLLLSIPSLITLKKNIGEVYALLLFATTANLIIAFCDDFMSLIASLMFLYISAASLGILSIHHSKGAEATTKLLFVASFVFAILGFATGLLYTLIGKTNFGALSELIAISPSAGFLILALLCLSILLITSFAPFHSTRVDVLHGFPFFAAGFLHINFLVAGGTLYYRLLVNLPEQWQQHITEFVFVLIGIGLVAPAISASDQSHVRRLLGFLVIGQSSCLLAALHLFGLGHLDLETTVFVLATCALSMFGAYSVLSCVEAAAEKQQTLEAWSGLGKQRPLFALSVLWMFGAIAGIPGTGGFSVRLVLAETFFATAHPIMGVLFIVTLIFSSLPVFRFGILLFAKTPTRHAYPVDQSVWQSLVIVFASLLIVALGLFFRPIIDLLGFVLSSGAPS